MNAILGDEPATRPPIIIESAENPSEPEAVIESVEQHVDEPASCDSESISSRSGTPASIMNTMK